MKTKRNHGFTLIELLVVITIIAILGSLAMSQSNTSQRTANQIKGVNNARQIITALKQFAVQNNNQYPDNLATATGGGMAASSNDAFRNMIIEGVVTDERIFGCPAGYSSKDNNSLGIAPGFAQALLPGENHWAMTQGQTDTSVGNMPMVFENPVSQGWPPQWNIDKAGQIAPGRAWAGGQIIVGRNDGSVEVINLNAKKGIAGARQTNGQDMFTQASQGQPLSVLNILVPGVGRSSDSIKDTPPPALGQQTGLGVPPSPLGQPSGQPPSPLGNP